MPDELWTEEDRLHIYFGDDEEVIQVAPGKSIALHEEGDDRWMAVLTTDALLYFVQVPPRDCRAHKEVKRCDSGESRRRSGGQVLSHDEKTGPLRRSASDQEITPCTEPGIVATSSGVAPGVGSNR